MTNSIARGLSRSAIACTLLLTLGVAALAQSPAAPAAEPTYKLGALTITAPWSRQPPTGARVAGGYLRITNTGQTADTLLGGSIPFAKRLEVHDMAMDAGVMKMRELDQGLEIKPGETVELKPGGLHLMFMDLTANPQAGQKHKLTLNFKKAGTIDVDLAVTPAGATTPGAAHHH